ncbi:hypothetical protein BDY19DRAFT_854168, partial [Irpex rosettiformis]
VHRASLVNASLHSPELLEMLSLNMSGALIEYATRQTIDTVDYALGRPSASRGVSFFRDDSHSTFHHFVHRVIDKANVTVAVLLVALVYLDRAKSYLSIAIEEWAYERTFLGALILADKFCSDITLKNIHWAICSGVFDKRDIGLIEREFLSVLDYELTVQESDLLTHHDALAPHAHP